MNIMKLNPFKAHIQPQRDHVIKWLQDKMATESKINHSTDEVLG